MAGSKRKAIRQEIVRRLKGNTDAGDNVFSNQTTANWDESLPVINIYPQSEDLVEHSESPRIMKRQLSLVIEIVAGGSEDPNTDGKQKLEDQLDDISYQVEQIISEDDSLDCTTDDIFLSNVEFQFEGNGGRPLGSCRLMWTAEYTDAFPEEREDGFGFKVAKADWHIGHHDDEPDLLDIEAQDEVEIPQ